MKYVSGYIDQDASLSMKFAWTSVVISVNSRPVTRYVLFNAVIVKNYSALNISLKLYHYDK